MTKSADLPSPGRPATQRLPLALLLTVAGLFLVGLAVGFVAVLIAEGGLPMKRPWLIALPIAALPLGLMALHKAWRLAAPPKDASHFERRYWKMWLCVFLLGAPLGMALTLPLGHPLGSLALNPFSSAPLDPVVALGLTGIGGALCIAAFVLYHRTIDEQEERGYLWASQIAYYFLSLLFPAWWLLQRGGLAPAMTIGLALGAVLVSFVIQGAVWAWFKFR